VLMGPDETAIGGGDGDTGWWGEVDGMMYVASEGARHETTRLHAIQPHSPRLADSS